MRELGLEGPRKSPSSWSTTRENFGLVLSLLQNRWSNFSKNETIKFFVFPEFCSSQVFSSVRCRRCCIGLTRFFSQSRSKNGLCKSQNHINCDRYSFRLDCLAHPSERHSEKKVSTFDDISIDCRNTWFVETVQQIKSARAVCISIPVVHAWLFVLSLAPTLRAWPFTPDTMVPSIYTSGTWPL